VKIIPLGVDPSLFEGIAHTEIEKIKFKIAGFGSPLGLFVGRLVYYKGVDTLIRAMQNVREMSLVILGEGPLKQELVGLTNELDLQKRVHFLSCLPPEEYPAIFSCADFLVLPSVERTEAFGIVALEAMAAGLPVITTELGTGTSYYNENGKTGIVVQPRAVDELAKAM
jgi:rhamnosyl/mannosyltransferase